MRSHTYFKKVDNKKENKNVTEQEDFVNVATADIVDYTINDFSNAEVTGCERLYMRSEPNVNSKPIMILDSRIKLKILDYKSQDFYKVAYNNNIGYCLKDFITILE